MDTSDFKGCLGALIFTGLLSALFLVVVWALFWMAGGFIWLASIGGESIFLGLVGRDAGTAGKCVLYLLDFEWLYGLILLVLLLMASKQDSGEGSKVPVMAVGIWLTALVIAIYDPRVAGVLPDFLGGPIRYMQGEWGFHLIGGVDMLSVDFSGGITDPLYYTLFDIILGSACVLWMIFYGISDD